MQNKQDTGTRGRRALSVGKYRGLQQCATSRGALAVLALDHRNSLLRALNLDPSAPGTEALMTSFKQQIVQQVGSNATALLLDPIYGAPQAIVSGLLPRDVGLLVALESSGYTGSSNARHSKVLPGWSVAQAKRMGASAVKLLVYYHPESPTAGEIRTLVSEVAAACEEHDVVFFLETLSYALDPNLSKPTGEDRREVVIETARQLTPLGADVLKTEFPLDAGLEKDALVWEEACQALSEASTIPWILLSAGVDYETYLRQVVIACKSGASGVAVGRAVWKEATNLDGLERAVFLRDVVRDRMARITAICDALARPWTDILAPSAVSIHWYEEYATL
jgi:tagatose 1,6-diphosphate aldolase